MRVRAWHNGTADKSQPAGYSVRISERDRDSTFDRTWSNVLLEVGDKLITVPISESFWRSCRELRSSEIGKWSLEEELAPWPWHRPPQMQLDRL